MLGGLDISEEGVREKEQVDESLSVESVSGNDTNDL